MSSITETIKTLGPARLGVMGAILVGMLLFFLFISMRASEPSLKLLYSDLSSVDSGAIAAKLEENQIPYDVSADGSRITVVESEVGRARLLLAEAGLPNGGSMGYEIFDKQSGFGTTNFVQNINQVRALEGELSRTISSIEDVRSTRVHLVLPERELFSRESRPPSASVYLGLRPGGRLQREQILAIQSLVASAVPNLKADEVTIIDSNGNLLARGGEEEGLDALSMKTEEMRRSYESRLMNKIQDQVRRIVGEGNVQANVTAEMNFDRISTAEELYDPSSQVVRSSQVTEESGLEREPINQDVSVENNLPGIGGDLLADNQPTAENNRLEEITNFEISKTIRNTVREVGEVSRLSVSVLVNGRYITNEEGERVYEERSAEELQQIEDLVRGAVGFDDNRGDIIAVTSMQFVDIDTNEDILDDSMLFGFPKADILDAAEMLLIGIMIVLVVLLVLQPMVSRLLAVEENEEEETMDMDLLAATAAGPALTGPSGEGHEDDDDIADTLIDIGGVEGKVKSSSVRKVEEIVENYPAETVAVIRSWMSQEG